mgnify:CR=1 FL=1
MGATYTRQSSYSDGDVIQANDTNNEFDQLLAVFQASSGHTHDGTANEGGPITKMLGTALTLGDGTAGTDIVVTFDGESSDGVLTWKEDEDYFEFSDDILLDTTEKLQFRDTAIYINSSADGQLDLVADTEIQIAATTIDMNGAVDISGNLGIGGNLTVTGTTTFNGGTMTLGDAATDNVVFGADVNSSIIPNTDNTYDLGSSGQEWKDIYIDGVAYLDAINFNGTAITSTAAEINIVDGDTSATATTIVDADRVVLNNNGTMVQVAVTDLAAYFDDEITAMPNLVTTAATTVGALNSGSITSGFGTIDTGSSTITTTGLITGGSLDIDDVVINGTTIGHTDDTDLMTLTSGVLTVAGEISVTTLDIGGTNVTSTAAELNILDGVTATAAELNYNDTGASVGTVVASKTVTVDANKDVASFRNITLTGELDAGSLDISGDADIAGTLTFDGTTLAETISDTVGAMVTSNTETGITVSYDDADNTLDFVIGTLNQDTTGNAATATALETARTIHGVSFDGTANIDLSEVVSDTVGAMFSSNTETGITATYQDADNTIDLVIGAGAIVNSMLADDAVGADELAANAVVTASIVDDNVTQAKIADDAVGADQLAANAVVEASIVDNAVTLAKMAGIARGKFIVGDASGNPSVIGPGTDGQVLTSDGTDIAFGDIPGASSLAADDLTIGNAAVLLTTSSGNITIDAAANDSDIIFKGTDGGGDITMLTLDGSADGAAIFKSTVATTGLIIGGTAVTSTAAELNILDGVTSTAAELNALDGITAVVGELNALDIGATAVGTAVASKAVILDSNKDYTGIRNFTISGELDADSLDIEGNADINGTLEADAITLNGTAITATATLSTGISNTNVAQFTSGVADNDFLKVAGTAIEGRSAAEVLSDIGASAVAGSGSIVTTGALNSGSITSGFGAIDNGASAITTTGTITGGVLTIDDITINGSTISDGGTMTMDIGGDLNIDVAGTDINIASAGTDFLRIDKSGTNARFESIVSDGDLLFRGNDGGSSFQALQLDMSAAGAAIFNNDVTAFSDRRLKTDIEPITNALPKVMQMQGVYYKRNDVKDAREQIGVIAQDMEAIIPEVVLTADDEMQTKSVDYGKLTSVLIEAIKELKAEINELKGV